jgi:hypothetical protein
MRTEGERALPLVQTCGQEVEITSTWEMLNLH